MTSTGANPPKIFQTRRWPIEAEEALDKLGVVRRTQEDKPLSATSLRNGLEECDVFCPTVSDTINADVVKGLDLAGKLIANFGAGVSHIDVPKVLAAGGAVTNTPDILTDATAEIAVLLMLATAPRASEGERELRSGQWAGWRPMHLLGQGVSGKTLRLVGFGRIAQAVARMAHGGFSMTILVANRSPIAPANLVPYGARQLPLNEMLSQSDFVSIHIPGGNSTRHLFDETRISQMKDGAILINTARGEIVDEAALILALETGHLAGAGLDVFEGEPTVSPALRARDDVVLLPHLGSATSETRIAMGLRVAENIGEWLGGVSPRDLVT